MAKKIRLDFSKVEERSGYNSRQMPEGLYEAKVTGLEQKEAQDGTDMLVYGLQPTMKKYATRNFPNFCKLQQNQLWKLRDLFVAAGETIPKKVANIDPESIIGAKVVIEVGDGTGQYSDRSEVIAVYPLSTLEDLDGDDEEDDEYEDEEDSEDEEDDSDEEYEDDEDEDDSDEEYEDDDEDLDEDEEDDDELDDEELEDEDDEEEEPAPKRARKPVAKKPAAKAPAKKAAPAKAAPKRVVKRRR